MQKQKITSRSDDFAEWYLNVIKSSDLADGSPVRGCMVIKPYGYSLWENIQKILDAQLKEMDVQNAYFPLLIPKSFLEKEAKHVEGFAKECAVVTHQRLGVDKEGKLIPQGELSEPYIIRPTSETIMYDMFAQWIESYRDLPLLINQWANVFRWELRTRPFLRTAEFLWQEGHTAHASKEEADELVLKILDLYYKFARDYLAIPVTLGKKSESEKFAGAVYTTTLEAMMQNGKALQLGTSHLLGQNFSKSIGVKFLDKDGKEKYVWQTSWAVTTRLIGALIMVHGDDKGIILPPKIAPFPVVAIPIWNSDETKSAIIKEVEKLRNELSNKGIRLKIDLRDDRPGSKFFDWEQKGVPLRIEIGPRDLEKNELILVRRDTGEKYVISTDDAVNKIVGLLEEIQKDLYNKALLYKEKLTTIVTKLEDIKDELNQRDCFILTHWCGNEGCEEQIKNNTGATIRCIPFEQSNQSGKCVACEKSTKQQVYVARAY